MLPDPRDKFIHRDSRRPFANRSTVIREICRATCSWSSRLGPEPELVVANLLAKVDQGVIADSQLREALDGVLESRGRSSRVRAASSVAISTIGCDCASKPAKTDLTLSTLAEDRLRIMKVRRATPQEGAARIVSQWLRGAERALLAPDAPLGWLASLGLHWRIIAPVKYCHRGRRPVSTNDGHEDSPPTLQIAIAEEQTILARLERCGVASMTEDDFVNNGIWNLAELRAFVEDEQDGMGAAQELISSISRSIEIFRYQKDTARDALKGFINEEEPHSAENFMLVLGGHDRQQEYYSAKLASEANLIASAYTARSLVEIFAQLLNALLLEPALPVPACTLKTVVARLPKSALRCACEELLKSPQFAYLSAFVNTAKHRLLVQHSLSINFQVPAVGVQFASFEFAGRSYPSYWANEFLQTMIDVQNAIVAAGSELNRTCLPPPAQRDPSCPEDVRGSL